MVFVQRDCTEGRSTGVGTGFWIYAQRVLSKKRAFYRLEHAARTCVVYETSDLRQPPMSHSVSQCMRNLIQIRAAKRISNEMRFRIVQFKQKLALSRLEVSAKKKLAHNNLKNSKPTPVVRALCQRVPMFRVRAGSIPRARTDLATHTLAASFNP